MVIAWPYHKWMAVRRGYRLEVAREARMMKRITEGDESIREEWDQEQFSRPDE